MSTTVRIDDHSKQLLEQIVEGSQQKQHEVLAIVIEKAWRKWMMEGINADFARLRQDKEAWDDYQNEMKAWDCTLSDGLEDYE